MKGSLSIKLSLIAAGAMILAMGSGVAVTYAIHTNLANSYVESKMQLLAHQYSSSLDDSFLAVENLVDEMKLLAEKSFPSKESIRKSEGRDAAVNAIRDLYALTASRTKYVCNYWFTFNPDYLDYITPETPEGEGFFCVRPNSKITSFVSYKVINVKAYDLNDPEQLNYIRWWKDVSKGSNIWMEPYFNANTSQNVLTYTVPIFSQAHEFLGATGIDLFFDDIVAALKDGGTFKDWWSFLINEDKTVAYHPDIQVYDEQGHYVPNSAKYSELLGPQEGRTIIGSSGEIVQYRYKDRTRIAATISLKNRMSYGVSVAAAELYDDFQVATFIPMAMYIIITIILAVGLFFIIRQAFKPLKELNNAIVKVREGDFGIDLRSKRNDEIGQLTRGFSSMVGALRSERSAMSALAFQDGLTGVKNKNAHAEKVMLLNRQIHDGMARFAVIMADVNNLKTINDGQGHVEGDRAIRGVCLRLCHVFAHSPVFRIGGDEFVAIAEGPDYDKREALYSSLVEDHFTDETHTFSFSAGMATFDPAVDKDFASVFERADDQMYEVKKKIKEEMKKPE